MGFLCPARCRAFRLLHDAAEPLIGPTSLGSPRDAAAHAQIVDEAAGSTLLYAQQSAQAHFRGVLERLTLIGLAGAAERGDADAQGSPPSRTAPLRQN